MKRLGWQVIPILIFFGLCIFLWRGLSLDPHRLPSVQIGKAVPAFELPQLLDANKVFNTKAFQGRVVLLNVWASWCQACVEEQAFLMQLANEGVDIYGLNYKDSADEAKHWLETFGNPYQIIGQDLDGRAAIDLGVYGAPETYVLDKQGIIRYRHVGPMKEEIWLSDIKPLMEQLKGAS